MAAKSLGAFGLLLLLSSVCGSASKETCVYVCVGVHVCLFCKHSGVHLDGYQGHYCYSPVVEKIKFQNQQLVHEL